MSERSKKVTGKIVRSLKSLADSLAKGDGIITKFTVTRIVGDLKPIKYGAEHVREARRTLRVSQAVFAQFIGVETCTVQSWEQGRVHPSGAVCRIIDEIRYDPGYWRSRLRDLMVRAVC